MTRSETLRDRCNKIPGVLLNTKSRRMDYIAQRRAFIALCMIHYGDSDTDTLIGEVVGINASTVSHYKKTRYFTENRNPNQYKLEKYWYKQFRGLMYFKAPVGKIQANMLLGVL